MQIPFLEDLDVKHKRVIVRVDFNVPLKNGIVNNDKRIRSVLPTLNYLVKNEAKIILMSHLGRPNGEIIESMRMLPVAKYLSQLINKEVKIVPFCIGEEVEKVANSLANGDILLLENLRFHKEETNNDPEFAKSLASLADIYINEAFGTVHRAHASTEGIAHYFNKKGVGFLMKKELDFLGKALENPPSPFIAIIGGAKISGKIDVIEALIPKIDKLLIGGGMSYTFLKAQGYEIGDSICEDEKIPLAKQLLEMAGDKLMLPTDAKMTTNFDFKNKTMSPLEVVNTHNIPKNIECVDIGPETTKNYQDILSKAKLVLWNGPMGVFEVSDSAEGTLAITQSLAKITTENNAITIVGGGDSVAAVEKLALEDKMSHVSTGGGASLEFLKGKGLPGIEILKQK